MRRCLPPKRRSATLGQNTKIFKIRPNSPMALKTTRITASTPMATQTATGATAMIALQGPGTIRMTIVNDQNVKVCQKWTMGHDKLTLEKNRQGDFEVSPFPMNHIFLQVVVSFPAC
jgi:hypothetical protein